MPIYEYKCADCQAISEILIMKKENENKLQCEECGSLKLKKTLSSFSVVDKANMSSGCCGISNPCDSPKRCCEK